MHSGYYAGKVYYRRRFRSADGGDQHGDVEFRWEFKVEVTTTAAKRMRGIAGEV